MMKKLHERVKITKTAIEPNEGERTLLCSNKGDLRSPFLGYLNTSANNFTEEMALDYLGQIIAEICLDKIYGNTTDEKSGNILPGIN